MAETFTFDPEQHIAIAGKVYERESMSEELKAGISHINFADQELATQEQNMRIYRIGRDEMVKSLIERIEGSDLKPVAVADEPDKPEEAVPVAAAA